MKMEEWKEYKLGDIYEVHNGLSKGGKFFGSGYPFLSFSTIFNNWFIPAELSNLVQSTDKEQESYSIKEGDVFITRTSETADELGMSCVALKDYPKATYNGFCKRMRQYNHNIEVLPKYIGYYLRNPNFRLYFQAFSGSMSTRASLTNEALLGLAVRLPPLPTQQKIAAILSSLDDKIELNNKINTNLEQQAQALFKNWFVDFEPFGGKMPEGWKVGKLSDIAEIKTDTFKPEQNPDIQVEHYSLPAFDEKRYPTFEISKELKSNKFIISNDEVLVSKLNPTVKRVWRPYCLTEKSICSTEFIVYKPISAELKDYLFSIVNSSEFNDFMCSNVTGSTNSHQRTPPKTTLNYEIPIPTKEILHKFCDIVAPMYDKIKENIKQNETVSSLRDTLLPKLMNGEIDV